MFFRFLSSLVSMQHFNVLVMRVKYRDRGDQKNKSEKSSQKRVLEKRKLFRKKLKDEFWIPLRRYAFRCSDFGMDLSTRSLRLREGYMQPQAVSDLNVLLANGLSSTINNRLVGIASLHLPCAVPGATGCIKGWLLPLQRLI